MSKSSFEIAGIKAASNEKQSQVLSLSFAGVATQLPLHIINGAHEGPTLVVTAAIHGAEYVGVAAAQRLARDTDPATLHGQLVVAPICSMTAFKKRAIYVCPPDDKNLNRMFPGDPNGTFAQQLAHWIFENLIRRSDVYIDLHGGDMNEALVPFSIVRRTGNANLDAKALAIAQAFGLPYIVGSIVSGSTYAAAANRGIPAVLAEVGGQGLWPEQDVQQMYEGLQRAVAHVGLITTNAPVAPATRLLEEMVWMRSKHDGMFYPAVNVNDVVQKGQVLGRVTDYLGNTLEELSAPTNGTILFVVSTLAMNNDDPLLAIGA
jgi:hypothetical protein